MTHEELLSLLGQGRLPPELIQPGITDLIALTGLGMLTALVAVVILRPFLNRRPSRSDLIRRTRGLAPEERLLAIARILGHLPKSLRQAAYGITPPPSDEVIERLAKARKR